MSPIATSRTNFFDETDTAEMVVAQQAPSLPTVPCAQEGAPASTSGWDRIVEDEPREVSTSSHEVVSPSPSELLQQDVASLVKDRLALQAEINRLKGSQDPESVVRSAIRGEVSEVNPNPNPNPPEWGAICSSCSPLLICVS